MRRQRRQGQSLAEYGLILALIAVVCIASLTSLGNNIKGGFLSLAASIGGAMAGGGGGAGGNSGGFGG